jgi:hypothetical protein
VVHAILFEFGLYIAVIHRLLVMNFAPLVERHPDSIDDLEDNGLLSSLLKQAYRSNVLTSVNNVSKR